MNRLRDMQVSQALRSLVSDQSEPRVKTMIEHAPRRPCLQRVHFLSAVFLIMEGKCLNIPDV
jgi:hypothetical protein